MALCRKIKAKLILQNLYTEYSLFDGFNQIPKLAPFWFKTGNLGTQRAQKQKREFKKPKREIVAPSGPRSKKGNLKLKREKVAPSGLRSKKGNLTRASIKSLRQRILRSKIPLNSRRVLPR